MARPAVLVRVIRWLVLGPAALVWWAASLGLAALVSCGDLEGQAVDSFPRDPIGHRYIEIERPTMDSAVAEKIVATWKLTLADGVIRYACLYGYPERVDGQLTVHLASVEPTDSIFRGHDLPEPECGSAAVGALAFQDHAPTNPSGVAAGMLHLMSMRPNYVFMAVVWGLWPVPPSDAARFHIPALVPRVFGAAWVRAPVPPSTEHRS